MRTRQKGYFVALRRGFALLTMLGFLLMLSALAQKPMTVTAGSQSNPNISEPGTPGVGFATVYSGHSPLLSTPPELSPEEAERIRDYMLQRGRSEPTPLSPIPLPSSPTSPEQPLPASPPSTQTATPKAGPAAAPQDFQFFVNKPVPSNAIITTLEPTPANSNEAILTTYNTNLAISPTDGDTWYYLDPRTIDVNGGFPQPYGGVFGDQSALYDRNTNTFFAVIQYRDSGTGTTNALRIAFFVTPDALLTGAWCYFDITPGNVGYPTTGSNARYFDYPMIALSNSSLYIGVNVGPSGTTNVNFGESTMIRIVLQGSGNCAGGPSLIYYYHNMNINSTDFVGTTVNLAPTQNAGSKMYFAIHKDNSHFRLFTWNETVGGPKGTVTWTDITHMAHTVGDWRCPGPDGLDWCGGIVQDRMLTGWYRGNEIGFYWNAARSFTGSPYPYPYVQGIRLNATTFSIIEEPVHWNSSYAIQFAAVGVNARNHLAGVVTYGGGSIYPSMAVWIWDDIRQSVNPNLAPWEWYYAVTGTSGPSLNRWGDFVGARRHHPNTNTWIGTSYTMQGGPNPSNAIPQFVWFGRSRDQSIFNNFGTAGRVFSVDAFGTVHSDRSFNCGLNIGSPTNCFNVGFSADIAEHIDVAETVEPGDVVEIDPQNPMQYHKMRFTYSHLVVGVISTNPGIVMANTLGNSDKRPTLALVGRIPVKVVAENGPIQIGDLLTTSSTPGYAMRCKSRQDCKEAILGKALEVSQTQKGKILMLITLR